MIYCGLARIVAAPTDNAPGRTFFCGGGQLKRATQRCDADPHPFSATRAIQRLLPTCQVPALHPFSQSGHWPDATQHGTAGLQLFNARRATKPVTPNKLMPALHPFTTRGQAGRDTHYDPAPRHFSLQAGQMSADTQTINASLQPFRAAGQPATGTHPKGARCATYPRSST